MSNPFFEHPILRDTKRMWPAFSGREIWGGGAAVSAVDSEGKSIWPQAAAILLSSPFPGQKPIWLQAVAKLEGSETPFEFPAQHAEWWEGRIARQQEIDRSIAAKAKFEHLYDKPYEASAVFEE